MGLHPAMATNTDQLTARFGARHGRFVVRRCAREQAEWECSSHACLCATPSHAGEREVAPQKCLTFSAEFRYDCSSYL